MEPIGNIMTILCITEMGPHLNTIEKNYIMKDKGRQPADKHTAGSHAIFDVITQNVTINSVASLRYNTPQYFIDTNKWMLSSTTHARVTYFCKFLCN
jgi:hypothetical protein